MSPETYPGGEHRERPPALTPRVNVASLSDYNAGRLHGAWIEANQTPEDLGHAITAMLARSPEPGAEEWAIHDYDDFGPVRLSEYETTETISRLARGLVEHGEAFGLWAVHLGPSLWDQLDDFDDHYLGEWTSAEDYAGDVLDDMGIDITEIGPEILRPYIDVDLAAFARDLACDIDILEGRNGNVHVFEP